MSIIIYTSKFINIISIIISIIIYIFINFFIYKVDFSINKVKFKADFVSEENSNQNETFNSSNLVEDNVIILNRNIPRVYINDEESKGDNYL